jgi:hypothetical protein
MYLMDLAKLVLEKDVSMKTWKLSNIERSPRAYISK